MWFLVGLIALEIVADIFAKEWGNRQRAQFFVLSLLAYVLANTSWLMFMMKENKLIIGANIFSISTGIIATIIGYAFYGETLTVHQFVGVVLGTISLGLIFF